MGSAIGGSSVARSPHGAYWVDVRDFGASTDYVFDNTPVFQAAVDALAARLAQARTLNPASKIKGTVFVPQSTNYYYLNSPVWVDSPYIEIRGEGVGTVLSMHGGTCHPLFIFGLRREVPAGPGIPSRLVADQRYRPDLFGKLDSTVVNGPNQRWGYRTNGDSFIHSQASPLACGGVGSLNTPDNWAESTSLCLEIAVEGTTSGQFDGDVPIMGLGVSTKGQLYPLTFYSDAPNHFVVLFCTQSQRFGKSTTRRFEFSSGSATGTQRLTIQIDLNSAVVSAFVNGVQVTTTNILGNDFAPGLRFVENDYYPLLIGDRGGDRPSFGNLSGRDFCVYGLCLSRTIRYRNDGSGHAQKRVDNPNSPITDLYRYFTPRFSPASETDSGMIGCLTFSDQPGNRLLTIEGGDASLNRKGSAFLFHSLMINPGGILGNGIHDISLIGGSLYGQNIAVGQVLDLSITGVRSESAYHAVGSVSNGANYTIRLEECFLDGCDSGYFGLDQSVWGRNVTIGNAGRASMRFVGSNANIENLTVVFAAPQNQSTIKIHTGDYGGNYSFRNVSVDYEGDTYLHAAFYCENHPYASSTSLRLEDIYLGTIGSVPLIMLREIDPAFTKATLIVENLQTYTDTFKAVLDVDGPSWSGEIKRLGGIREAPRIDFHPTLGPECHVVIREHHYKAPPRTNQWVVGAHILDVPSPVDGQFTEWRCISTGIFGTAVPPEWSGINPVASKNTKLAAYVLNHGFITATLS